MPCWALRTWPSVSLPHAARPPPPPPRVAWGCAHAQDTVAHASSAAARTMRPPSRARCSPPPASVPSLMMGSRVAEGVAWGVERYSADTRHTAVCHASTSFEPPQAQSQGASGDVRTATATAGSGAGQRMDAFLTEQLTPVSRAKVQALIKAGHVCVNGQVETRARAKLKKGDEVRCFIPPPEPLEAVPEDIPLDIVYEDHHLIVVNKQAHLVVHPAPGNRSGTLVNAILFHCGLPAVRLVEGGRAEGGLLSGRSTEARTGGSDEVVGSESGEQQQQQQHDENDDDDDDDDDASVRLLLAGEDTSRSSSMERSSQDPVIRPGIVHRLDKGTSGLLVIAKDDITHRGLCEQFAERSVKRSYLAVTCGVPEEPRGRVVANIGRSMRDRKAMAVVEENAGRHAASKYLVREELGSGGAALVEWRLETGRTHQIRVHAKHINTPLFGDDTYGGGPPQAAGRCARPAAGFTPQKIKSLATKLARPALHALTLGFVHPATGEELSFQTDPPEDFVTLVEALRTPPDLGKDNIAKALGYTTDDD